MENPVDSTTFICVKHRDGPTPLVQMSTPEHSASAAFDVDFVDVSFTTQVPVHDRGIRTSYTVFMDAIVGPFKPQKTKDRIILDSLTGKLKAKSSTLLLGSPGCGKTAFLKVLAGRTPFDDGKKTTSLRGKVTIGGTEVSDLDVERVVGFVEQIDNHLPLMTVRQTLDFAAEVGNVPGGTDEVVKNLGLEAAIDTRVGNAFIRGVSGGERKRVTIGEMILRNQGFLLCDEITTGLDAATARDVVEYITNRDATVLMSLLQPPPEIVDLFDDLILMTQGKIIYHGPVNEVETFFESVGYRNRPGRSIGEFLLDMTTVRRHRYYFGEGDGMAAPQHKVHGLVNAWSSVKPAMEESAKATNEVVKKGKYELSRWKELVVVAKRQFRLLWIERLILVALLGQTLAMGIMMGIVFLKTPFAPQFPGDTVWMRNRYSVMFFALMLFALNTFALVPWMLIQRDVYYKQNTAGMYRTANFVWSTFFTESITTVPQAVVLISVIFFMVQMTNPAEPDVGKVFGLWLVLSIFFGLAISNLMRLITFLCPSVIVAFIVNAMAVSVSLLFGGFLIAESELPGWVVWLYWMTPMSYTLRAISIVVFESDTFSNGLGEIALKSLSFRSEDYWVGVSIGYCVGFTLLCVSLQVVALEYIKFGRSGRASGSGGNWNDEEDVDEIAKLELKNKDEEVAQDELAIENEKNVFDPRLTTLECPKVDLSFSHMMYSVKVKKQDKVLVNDVNGYVRSGRMCAIIGATGAGKTTTQDLLAGRKTQGTIGGEILLNGRVVEDRLAYQRLIGYCEQDDNHSAFSSVREAVQFSAALRLPPDTPEETAHEFVEGILASLSLDEIAEHKIGIKGKGGLSVGQFKRLTVAVELAANPALIYLDEPTSGLDATAAETTMHAVKRLCDSGRTILCTIHQPSREVFALFDDILLLQKGGRVAYHGSVKDMVPYFSAIPENKLPVPAGDFNASTYVLEVLGAGVAGQAQGDDVEAGSAKIEYDYATHFEASAEAKAVMAAIEKGRSGDALIDWPLPATKFSAAVAVTRRWFVAYWRAPEYTLLRGVVFIALAIVLGATFFGEGGNIKDVATAQSAVGVVFFLLSMSGMMTTIMCLGFIFQMRSVFYRERNASIYSVSAFLFGSSVSEVWYVFWANLLMTIIFYPMMKLRADGVAIVLFFVFNYVQLLAMTFLGHLLTSTTQGVAFAILIGAALISTYSMFSGFLIPYEECTKVLSWLFFLSPPMFAINGIVYSQYGCDCAVDGNLNASGPNFTCDGGQSCATVCDASAPGCDFLQLPTPDGGFVYQTVWQFMQIAFGMRPVAWWVDFLPLVAFSVAFRIFDAVALSYLNFSKR